LFCFLFNCSYQQADYELVTSAFSLLELPNRIQRFETIENLFGKVKKNGYLVLIETGNRHGFKLISEAREFIINVFVRI
jgi:ribosomal protein RSM22 (predicted rRNA methylase)